MKPEPGLHLNKFDAGRCMPQRCICGRELEAGDILEAGDMYESTSGIWEPNPGVIGLPIGPGTACKWVRPCDLKELGDQ